MPEEHCFVCASDEGIFLDIFTDGKNCRDIIETCLSLKIQKTTTQSTKICHKCVFELDQCSKFVQKYKKTHRMEKGKLYKKRGCCCLCMMPGKKGYIFDLWDENRLDNSVEKLHELFDIDCVMDNLCQLSICLDCRYNLDVLFDLKGLYNDTSRCIEDILNGDMTLSELPKVSTSVVKRKTTLNRMSKLSQSKSSLADSDASTIVIGSPKRLRALSSRKSSPHARKCDECNVKIDNGMDMYRYHHTGNTVCRECWLTMDPCEKTKSKAREVNNKTMKTKLCSVFLEDILTNSLETEKQIPHCTVEKGVDGEIIYVISSDETDNENEKKMLSTRLAKTKRKASVVETKPTKKLKTQHPKRSKLTRSNSAQSINVIEKKNTRQTRSESAETSDSEGKNRRKRSETIRKSPVSKSKSPDEKKSKESTRPRALVTKKRKTDKSELSSSGSEVVIPSKVRRFPSPSYDIDSIYDSKSESDSDNKPYTCKICSNDYENKVVGLTHELTHSKKLGVMLKKVAMPEVTEGDKMLEREPSIEFDSPAPSNCGLPETPSDFHSVVTDESTLRELSDIPEDPSDDNPHIQNSEDKSEEEGGKKKKEMGKAKNKKKETIKNKKKGTVKDKKKEIGDETEIEKKTEEEKGEEKETNKAEDEKKEAEKEDSASGSIQGDESIHKAADDGVNDIEKQPTETTKPNIDEEVHQSNGKDSSEETEIGENKILTDDKSDKKNKHDIENEEKDSSNSAEEKIDDKITLENSDKMDEDKKDSTSLSAIVENDNEKLADENNKENNENETVQNENSNNEKKEVDECKEPDEKETEDEVREEKNEKISDELISNGNVRKLSNVESAENNGDKVDKLEETECTKVPDKSEEYPDNVKGTGEKNDDVAMDEMNNATPSGDLQSNVNDTVVDIDNDKNKRTESSEIENRLAEMMGESELKDPEVIEGKKSDEIKNAEQVPSSELIAMEENGCES